MDIHRTITTKARLLPGAAVVTSIPIGTDHLLNTSAVEEEVVVVMAGDQCLSVAAAETERERETSFLLISDHPLVPRPVLGLGPPDHLVVGLEVPDLGTLALPMVVGRAIVPDLDLPRGTILHLDSAVPDLGHFLLHQLTKVEGEREEVRPCLCRQCLRLKAMETIWVRQRDRDSKRD
jgi:hypothetical protein